MEYKKERNFIVANELGQIIGKWDILTGEFYGKKGTVVKGVPSCFTYDNLNPYHNNRSLMAQAIYNYRHWVSDGNTYTRAMAQRLEEIISLGLTLTSFHSLCVEGSNIKLTKDIVDYLKENYNGQYYPEEISNYLKRKKYKDFLTDKPTYIINIFNSLINDYPYDYLKAILTRIMNEHCTALWNAREEYSINNIITIVRNYYNYCKAMYGEVKVTPNILSNYAQICHLYNEWQNAHYNEILAANNDKPILYFQHGNYFARPLKTKEDFHFEGESQHNCVERMYMERVCNNDTYIVVVRDINNPDHSLITCEVSHQGVIRQYLAKFNSRNISVPLMDFKSKYQAHLMETMGDYSPIFFC